MPFDFQYNGRSDTYATVNITYALTEPEQETTSTPLRCVDYNGHTVS